MASFSEWLTQNGLAHRRSVLVQNGIDDFDVLPALTREDLIGLGLNLGDTLRLLQAAATTASRDVALPAPRRVTGQALERTPLSHDENRQLTVMFCDLVGYTELNQRLDREQVKKLRDAYFQACTTTVQAYDGNVRQYLGDGVMVYFGFPDAHENDAERSVRAALEIVEAVKGIAGGALAVRVGVATGSVVVGEAARENTAGDSLAVGETPNLAARLQEGVASAGEVVIDPGTRLLIGNFFDLTDLGEHTLKGIVQPVRSWRVRAVNRSRDRFDAVHGDVPLTDLVGREEEVALLMRHWLLARSGEGQVVLLSGEAGIGKSRLTQVLSERIRLEPHIVMRYQCSPFQLNAPLHPIVEQLEFAAGFTRDDTPEQKLDKLDAVLVGSQPQRIEAATLFAPLLSLPTTRYPLLGLSPQRQKEKMLDALIAQVEALSRLQPVLIVFEDAHWIDPTSRELIELIVPRLRSLRVMLVLTYRPQYTPRADGYGHVATIGLTGLPQHLGNELVGKVTQGKALPQQVLARIVAHADGVPLFIEELTKSMLESPLLHEEADRYTALESLALEVPKTLNASLIERLGRRVGVRELAQIGSCIGREFSYELLAAASRYAGAEFDEELEQLVGTGLVFRRGTPPEATYTFKHALVRDAAYDSLLRSKRQRLHARIAEALEQRFAETVAHEPELLARHYTEAGRLAEAVPLWRRAGEAALARVANKEAVAYLKEGLTVVDQLPPSAERDTLELSLREPLHAARLRFQGWAEPEVGANAKAILRLAGSQDSPQSLLVGLWGMWVNTVTQGRIAEAPHWAERLLAEGDTSNNVDLQILGHRGSMTSQFYLGRLAAADKHGNSATALYTPERAGYWKELTGSDVRTAVGVFSAQWLWMLGYPERAKQVSDEKDDHARRLGHPFDLGWALTWGSYVFDYRGEPERLLEKVGEAHLLGCEQSIPLISRVLVPLGEGLARLRLGDLDQAVAQLRRGITAWNAGGGHLHVPVLQVRARRSARAQGRGRCRIPAARRMRSTNRAAGMGRAGVAAGGLADERLAVAAAAGERRRRRSRAPAVD